jgi:2-polyprenyl-3-methyl-5-hydroxy-6-metoxy-1,4-benzoquinol methylase
MKNKVASCPVCGSSCCRIVYILKSGGSHAENVVAKCMACGTAYLHDPDHSFQEDLYTYYEKFAGVSMEELVSPFTLASYQRVLCRLANYGDLCTILDVGCGKGEFVWAATRSGYSIQGLELSAQAVSVAQALGLPVKQKSIYSSEWGLGSWNVITMFEVIEHVDRPISMLRRATDLLAQGGLLYLTTPNYNSLDRFFLGAYWDVFHPEHISYFSTYGLVGLLRKLEPRLQIISVESHNISPQLLGCIIDRTRRLFRFALSEEVELNSRDGNTLIDLRSLAEGTVYSRFAKRVINRFLTMAGAGSTTILIAKKVTS